ncbi:hypothetical protein BS17DRAFT_702397 [Gyrodon lividus]|nr:hypothetical protein BS17DRAFT_702397 [Gyrodon lividus]
MQTGYGLHSLFVIILLHCNPVDHHQLWTATCQHLCDDLQHHLIYQLNIPEPTEEQIYDYGLYLIDLALYKHGKNLGNFIDLR